MNEKHHKTDQNTHNVKSDRICELIFLGYALGDTLLFTSNELGLNYGIIKNTTEHIKGTQTLRISIDQNENAIMILSITDDRVTGYLNLINQNITFRIKTDSQTKNVFVHKDSDPDVLPSGGPLLPPKKN